MAILQAVRRKLALSKPVFELRRSHTKLRRNIICWIAAPVVDFPFRTLGGPQLHLQDALPESWTHRGRSGVGEVLLGGGLVVGSTSSDACEYLHDLVR
jgi:hypothetical protein